MKKSKTNWLNCFCKLNRREVKKSSCFSVASTSNHLIERPEISIYSQGYNFTQGLNPTWNSPDIEFIKNEKLMNELSYFISNNSSVPAINSRVDVYVSEFGIGLDKLLMASDIVTIPANQRLKLTKDISNINLNSNERGGVFIELSHPYDKNVFNNYGSQILQMVKTSNVGRNFKIDFELKNGTLYNRNYILQYTNNEITTGFSENAIYLLPNETRKIKLNFNVPISISGSSSNSIRRTTDVIVKTSAGELVGGLSIITVINN